MTDQSLTTLEIIVVGNALRKLRDLLKVPSPYQPETWISGKLRHRIFDQLRFTKLGFPG